MTTISKLEGITLGDETVVDGIRVVQAAFSMAPADCYHCHSAEYVRFGSRPQKVWDVPSGMPTRLVIETSRYRCKTCSQTFTATAPAMDAGGRQMTARLTEWIREQAIARPHTAIAAEAGITSTTVKNIVVSTVRAAQSSPPAQLPAVPTIKEAEHAVADTEAASVVEHQSESPEEFPAVDWKEISPAVMAKPVPDPGLQAIQYPTWIDIGPLILHGEQILISDFNEGEMLTLISAGTTADVSSKLMSLPGRESVQIVSIPPLDAKLRDSVEIAFPQATLLCDANVLVQEVRNAIDVALDDTIGRLPEELAADIKDNRHLLYKQNDDLSDEEALILHNWALNSPVIADLFRVHSAFLQMWRETTAVTLVEEMDVWKAAIPGRIRHHFRDFDNLLKDWIDPLIAGYGKRKLYQFVPAAERITPQIRATKTISEARTLVNKLFYEKV